MHYCENKIKQTPINPFLNPDRYPAEVRKVLASGRTPAGMHVPIMVDEVVRFARPQPGDVAVDCTLGGGGHAQAILERRAIGGERGDVEPDPLEEHAGDLIGVLIGVEDVRAMPETGNNLSRAIAS